MSNNIRLDTIDNGIYRLTFDCEGSSANVFDRETLQELSGHLDSLSGDTQMRGLIITSAKPSIFIAGADINELLSAKSTEDELTEMVRYGQKTFSRIAELRVPTVAAIHGVALGGGGEICLACDYRIASADKVTKIGFPETSLGILPAWGGCVRLPRLIGLPKALGIILAGKQLAAKPALKAGLIDKIVPREHFERIALDFIAKGKPTRKSHFLTNNLPIAKFIASRARKSVVAKTGGHYPAPIRALEVVSAGISKDFTAAEALEVAAFLELVRTDVCRNLVRIFFLQERSKKLTYQDLKNKVPPVESAMVVGAGVMGAGIAQWLSARGLRVILKDIAEEYVLKGMKTIGKLYRDAAKRHLMTRAEAQQGMDRIYPTHEGLPIKKVEMVIEAAVESIEIKKKIFSLLDQQTGDDAVLATNTSALSITEIATALRNPGRLVGIHYFNPVHRMKLVEVVVGDKTDPITVQRAVKFVQKTGKLPVIVKDAPGFVVNRILMPYLVEAGLLFEEGISPEEIDRVMLEFGMPMGPLRLIDEVGVDVADHVASFLSEKFGERMPLPSVLKTMVDSKQLGRKTGAGFYKYSSGRGKKAEVNSEISIPVKEGEAAGVGHELMRRRMTLLMVNEAARCIEENVVDAPEDIDFAMIMGTGFAPFRGGPLRYAESVGIDTVCAQMEDLGATVSPRFLPCELIRKMASDHQMFYVNQN